jgi:hypothetical protein
MSRAFLAWPPCHARSGQADRARVAMAEWVRGETDRHDDHLIVLGECQLRRMLRQYAAYDNGVRTHWALNLDAPVHRAVQSVGAITFRSVLGGPHHQYCRI